MPLTEQNAGALKDVEAQADEPVSKKDQLLLGRYRVSPQQLFRYLVGAYVAFFLVHRIADVVYLLQVDCRFPVGLGYDYTSDMQRQQAVSYVRSTIIASMCRQTLNFILVLIIVFSGALVAFDQLLTKILSVISEKCSWCCGVCSSCSTCMCSCCSCMLGCFGFEPKWTELFRGALYLTVVGAFFYMVNAPFTLWMYKINASYGFTNVLTMPESAMMTSIVNGFQSTLITGIPSFMVYLLILSHRWGWAMLYVGVLTLSILVQYNVGTFASMLFDASNVFPAANFGVANGFPLAGSDRNVSLNRIFYPTNATDQHFVTQDYSRGPLQLGPEGGAKRGKWQIMDAKPGDGAKPYAETNTAVIVKDGEHGLDDLEAKQWSVSNGESAAQAHVNVRRGKQLRDELFGFAEERNIHVSQVYMIEGSHADTRANAFAAGAGDDRIIGLYDTLFLGTSSEEEAPGDESSGTRMEEMYSMRSLGALLRGVDTSEGTMRPKRRSMPTQAMTNIEILAIMGHELGHTALHHIEAGMAVEAVSSFLTFAVLGWIVHCPLVAASLGLSAPVAHIALFVYNRVVGGPLDSTVGLVTSWISRRNEFAADAYSAHVSEEYATGLQTALAKLTINSNNDPSEPWFYEVLHNDHPTTAKRWYQVSRIKRELYPKNDGSDTDS